jgi:hypothetical protein
VREEFAGSVRRTARLQQAPELAPAAQSPAAPAHTAPEMTATELQTREARIS